MSSKRRVPLESQIERVSVIAATKAGWSNTKIEGSYYRTGFPDRLFWKDNNYVWIEYKRPGQSLTEKQAIVHRKLVRQGCKVYVCHSATETMEVLNNAY